MLLFDQTIRKIEIIFRCAGINIRSGKQKPSNGLKSKKLYLFNFSWIESDVIPTICWLIDGILKGKDFLEITYLAPCVSYSTLGTFKGMFMILNEKSIHKLIDNLRKLDMQEGDRKKSLKRDEIIEKERKFLHIAIKTINILYVFVIIAFALSPVVFMGVKYYQTNELELMYQFSVLYPFDPFQSIYIWPFVYLHQLWSECVVSLNTCASDNFFFTCCSYICIHFRLLKHDLENIIPIEVNSKKKFYEDVEFKNRFIELVKRHEDLIQSANILETIYSKATLLNFMSSSFIICLAGFNVTVVDDIACIFAFLSFLFMSLAQVFFLCFFADLMTTSSMEIATAVYNCPWYMAEAKIAKKLLMVQARSGHPCQLTASGFAFVNLNSFMRVLSTSYSYFALLQTMYGN